MKRTTFNFLGALLFVGVVSCNQSSNSSTSTDSTSTSTTTGESASGSTTASSTTAATVDENATYLDLSTGKNIKVKKDQTGRYINSETNEPLKYYVNPTTADTFDVEGRVVNNALVKAPNGDYSVDENKITTSDGKIKTQGDGDVKFKQGDVKGKVETDGDMKLKQGDTKEKVKDDEYKRKDESGTTKEKSGQ